MYVCVYFYTASFSPLLLRGGPDNSPQAGVSEFHAEAQWAWVVSEELATWRLGRGSNPRRSGRRQTHLPAVPPRLTFDDDDDDDDDLCG